MSAAKKKVLRIMSVLFILAGIAVALYPTADHWFADRKEQQLLTQAEQQVLHPSTPISHVDSDPRVTKPAPAPIDYNKTAETEEMEKSLNIIPNVHKQVAPVGSTLGIIEIDKIAVKLPILEGSTRDNMRSAATHISGTAELGTVGNTAIAAHRAHKTGRLFNRLGEMTIGDQIQILTNGEHYQYVVDRITRVQPTDVSVLQGNGIDKELTLITCDPLINPTCRLIVHAVLKS